MSLQVLIVGSQDKRDNRPHEAFIEHFNANYMTYFRLGTLENVDSSGTRSVYIYTKDGSGSYDKATDIPKDIYEHLGIAMKMCNVPVHLFLRQEDPGLAIILPQDNSDNGFSYRQNKPLEAFA
tara:strand:- start:462 stop:830 length:369 start_codon:yes stop_codon:yes gene_type:complete